MRSGRRVVALLAMLAMLVTGCSRGGRQAVTQDHRQGQNPALVQTSAGTLRGTVTSDHRLFAGVPYAAAPVGPLRFTPPVPAPGWSGERDATRPGPRCIQDPSADPERGLNTAEDCLTLNVWTPPVSDERRPVMVWIHGGAFVNGSSGIYDAGRLAAHGGIVVVTINYRLGALGFLAHPALGAGGDVGNYGLADQQAALRWVRDNIDDFGGDPEKVTVAGESAGGMSVCDHLVAPGSAGLFRAAILMSAPCQAQADLAAASRRSLDYAADVGCPDPAAAAACLRSLPVDRLRKPVWYFNIGSDELAGPVTGSALVPQAPLAAFGSGRVEPVPVLIGTTRDEFTLFVALRYLRQGQNYTAGDYPPLLVETFGADAAAVGAHYPIDRYGGVAQAYSAAVTDGEFACVSDLMANQLSRTGPVYAYEFNDRAAPAPEVMRTLPFPVGASHSLELRYLFDVGGAPPMNPAQQRLSEQMIGYWSAFVRTADPAVDGQPGWPEFGANRMSTRMSLQADGSRTNNDYARVHQCPFWAGLREK
ncbi:MULTISPECIES: carboxylesterase/lipase family protein [unclassified Mycolicibacterium]|uniref:carboxylesterase/lipase family protein n=1 Tax=unclassified Mycolicibacterium TaxID=2636767 RepID=UPI0012DD5F9F|nr:MULTISPECIES: carboxylesterase family protein [unclassified Mycolicibacterium]MUL81455.1 carboxylesterase family protein [Mycolicibacterium sp. CBMA 329]MUL87221.1 carboxylesterase family protein [Mycolicibacterium sp. CBMA 331]MUL98497.1 carboxylesterase family protein [Mycolicibacterium sp. CBMA 334]MUM25251.1 carboxylesterase family protein [Mycolicibacterium sp. CBMA 295]MUM37518.1 carboxylesterase family protein [Mycolicibacterium sp. CBMA 247]